MNIQDLTNTNYVSSINGQSQNPVSILPLNPVSNRVSSIKPDEPSQQSIKNAVEDIKNSVKQHHTNLDISIDNNAKEVVVKVTDSTTGDVITQFPSKEALAISESIKVNQKGIFLNKKA